MWDREPQPQKKKKKTLPKQTIGRREMVDFPDLDLFGLTAKIDTGAYTSALHCTAVEVINGVLHFRLLDETLPEYSDRVHRFTEFTQKAIKSSTGEVELRYIIKTRIRLGTRVIKSIVSLADRGSMRYPVLLGRRLLNKRFIVDVASLNLLQNPLFHEDSHPIA